MGGKDRNFRIRLEKREKPGKGERKGQREKKDRHFCGKKREKKSGKRAGKKEREKDRHFEPEKDRHFEPFEPGKDRERKERKKREKGQAFLPVFARHFCPGRKRTGIFARKDGKNKTRKRTGTSLSVDEKRTGTSLSRKGQALLCHFFVSVAAVAFFLSPFSR